jgi:hypothetical protein
MIALRFVIDAGFTDNAQLIPGEQSWQKFKLSTATLPPMQQWKSSNVTAR